LPNRGVIAAPMRAGDPVDLPLVDRAYLTSRFPGGIRRGELAWQPLEIQRHTALTWFVRNYEPARGTFFGFAEASSPEISTFDGSARFNGSIRYGAPENPDLRVAGFDQAPFFNGGMADDLLRTEFEDSVDQGVLADLASALPGLWRPRTDLPLIPGTSIDDLRAVLARELDEFDAGIRKLPTVSRGRWDNDPPVRLPDESAAIEPEERDGILRATADMRLAVVSKDYSTAAAIWEAVQPSVLKVAAYLARKLDSMIDAAVKVVGVGLGTVALVGILIACGVLDGAEAISPTLKALHLK